MISGYSNEKRFVEVFNDKFIYQLEEKYVRFLEDIYEKKLDKNSYVICWKPVVNEKADIIIRVGSEKKRLSIKTGKNNSVHMEKLSSFIKFLKELLDIRKEVALKPEKDCLFDAIIANIKEVKKAIK